MEIFCDAQYFQVFKRVKIAYQFIFLINSTVDLISHFSPTFGLSESSNHGKFLWKTEKILQSNKIMLLNGSTVLFVQY